MAKRKQPKTKPEDEIVTQCDACGKPLGRSCVRTNGSSVCAAAAGIAVVRHEGKIAYCCDGKCANAYHTAHH